MINKTRIFIEHSSFSGLVESGEMTDADLKAIQNDIMAGLGDTMPRTGGLKKLRGKTRSTGKRGGWRVIFADYASRQITILIVAYRKAKQENLTPSQEKSMRTLKACLDKQIKEI